MYSPKINVKQQLCESALAEGSLRTVSSTIEILSEYCGTKLASQTISTFEPPVIICDEKPRHQPSTSL